MGERLTADREAEIRRDALAWAAELAQRRCDDWQADAHAPDAPGFLLDKAEEAGDIADALRQEATPGQAAVRAQLVPRIEAILPGDPRGQPVPYYRGLVALVSSSPSLALVTADGESVPSATWPEVARRLAAAWNATRDRTIEDLEAQA